MGFPGPERPTFLGPERQLFHVSDFKSVAPETTYHC